MGDDKLPIHIVDGSALININIPEDAKISLDMLEPTPEANPEQPE
jgi:hypothetical protein